MIDPGHRRDYTAAVSAELVTGVTDFILAALCGAFAVALGRRSRAWLLYGPIMLFVGFALAALAGGIWHAFYSARQDLVQAIVWWCSMLFAGVTAAGLALVGLELLGVTRARIALGLVTLLLGVYAVWSWLDPRFLLSLLATVLGTLLCVAGLLRHARTPGSALVLAGLAVSTVAAIAQQRGVALDPVRFDHNATYHLALLPALLLIYLGLLRLSEIRSVPTTHHAIP